MPDKSLEIFSIQLNSCLHRIDCKSSLLSLVNEHGCSLKRIRRSRHWLLQGSVEQLRTLKESLRLEQPLWISAAIDKALPKPSFDLATVLAAEPSLSVNELMLKTSCSQSEARAAIDKAEGFN